MGIIDNYFFKNSELEGTPLNLNTWELCLKERAYSKKLKFYNEMDWEGEIISRDSFDKRPGDREDLKILENFLNLSDLVFGFS